MGAQLVNIIEIVEEKAGTNGRLELAKITKVSKSKAETLPDTPDNVATMKRAASKVLGRSIDELMS